MSGLIATRSTTTLKCSGRLRAAGLDRVREEHTIDFPIVPEAGFDNNPMTIELVSRVGAELQVRLGVDVVVVDGAVFKRDLELEGFAGPRPGNEGRTRLA